MLRAGQKFLWRDTASKPAQTVIVVSVEASGALWGVLDGRDRRWGQEEWKRGEQDGRLVWLDPQPEPEPQQAELPLELVEGVAPDSQGSTEGTVAG